jgi:hypothetical protein
MSLASWNQNDNKFWSEEEFTTDEELIIENKPLEIKNIIQKFEQVNFLY